MSIKREMYMRNIIILIIATLLFSSCQEEKTTIHIDTKIAIPIPHLN